MEFTCEQISEIISEITNGELGLQGLVKQGLESLMLSERDLHNETRCLLYTSPSPRDLSTSRMPSSA